MDGSITQDANKGDGPGTQESIDPLFEYCDRLSYRMHLTRGARYQAARRHKHRSMASTWAVTALSMYVFSASAYMAIFDLKTKPEIQQPLILMTIIMSSFIIAFSILEQGKKHDLKAELFLRCAQKIQELRDGLELDFRIKGINHAEVDSYVKKYNEIVHDFAENHSETDYRTFRANIGKHGGQYFYVFWQHMKYWVDCWAIMLFAIIVPPIVFSIIVVFSILRP